MFGFGKTRHIYMDHAATTPMDGEVLRAMNDGYKNSYFNPGGLYAGGVATLQKITESRKSVAQLIGTTSDHVIFTRGGTESCNMAVMGVVNKIQDTKNTIQTKPHVIMSEIEHSAVLETLKNLEKNNQIELSIIPVDEQGMVIVDEIKKALRPETVLVSIMYVNNEIGTIQPIREIAKLVRWYKKQKIQDTKNKIQTEIYPLIHTDAIQAVNYLDIHVDHLGVDLMSLSGSKIYGPKSSGVLYVRNREMIAPIFHGGDQEFGLRAGTEDVAGIVGFAKALEIARASAASEHERLEKLQKFFWEEIQKNISDILINGSIEDRISNNINISIPKISSERLVIELNAQGIAASSKSACKSDSDEESHVIAALRKHHTVNTQTQTEGSIRFTMGRETTKSDVEYTVQKLSEIVRKIQEFEKTL